MEKESDVLTRYYAETEPELRRPLLDSCSSDGTAGSQELRNQLWELRYTDPKDKTRYVDRYLWQIVNLLYIYKLAGVKCARKSCIKEVREAAESMGFPLAKQYPDSDDLYQELRNAMRRYFSTCDCHSYGRKLFGIISMNDHERLDKIAREAWQLYEGLPERLGMRDVLDPLSRAARDEYLALYGEKHWPRTGASQQPA